jgi:uncharacterized membrane protein
MKRVLVGCQVVGLVISIVLIVAGIVGYIYANQYSHVTPEGMVVDSPLLLLGPLMTIVGVLGLFVVGVLFLIGFLRKRLKR